MKLIFLKINKWKRAGESVERFEIEERCRLGGSEGNPVLYPEGVMGVARITRQILPYDRQPSSFQMRLGWAGTFPLQFRIKF